MRLRWFGHTVEPEPFEPEPDETCPNCRYHDTEHDDEGTVDLICRRYPPLVLPDGDLFTQVYPSMSAEDWCGEWAA